MNPEPGTNTATFGTRWHPFRNLEVCKPMEDASLVYTENGEILGLNLVHVALVSDSERATLQVVWPISVVFCSRPSRTRVVPTTNISTFGRGEEGSCSLVTSDFGCGWFSGWQFEKISRAGKKGKY